MYHGGGRPIASPSSMVLRGIFTCTAHQSNREQTVLRLCDVRTYCVIVIGRAWSYHKFTFAINSEAFLWKLASKMGSNRHSFVHVIYVPDRRCATNTPDLANVAQSSGRHSLWIFCVVHNSMLATHKWAWTSSLVPKLINRFIRHSGVESRMKKEAIYIVCKISLQPP